jgi:hypothetical protein
VTIDQKQIDWFENMLVTPPPGKGWKIFVFTHAPANASGLWVLQENHVVSGCCWLHTSAGGLKSTLMASFIHTMLIFLMVTMIMIVYTKVYSSDMVIYTYHPIGFSTPPFASFNNPLYMEGDFVSNLEWLREAELAHGRIAQLAVIRFIWPGLFGTFPGSNEFGSIVAYSELNPLRAIKTVPESVLHQIITGMEWFEYQRVIRIKEQGSSLLLNDISSFPNLSPSGPPSIQPSIPRCARPGSTNAEYIHMAYVVVEVHGGSNNHNYANVTLIVELSRLHGVHASWARSGHVPEKLSLPNAIAPSDPPIQFAGPAGPPMRSHVKMTNGRGGMAAEEKLINPHTVSFYVHHYYISAISNRLFPIAHRCDQCNANVAKETEAKSFGVEVVNSWKNGGIKVSFMSDDEYVVIAISVISH